MHIRTLTGDGVLATGTVEAPVTYTIQGFREGGMKTATGTLAGDEDALWSGLGLTITLHLQGGGQASVILTSVRDGMADFRCSGPVPGI